MQDGITYYNKNTKAIAQDTLPSISKLTDTMFYNFHDVACLPFTGQCYKVTCNDEYKRKERYSRFPMEYKLDFYENRITEWKIDDGHYNGTDDYTFYIKDGKFTNDSCTIGDVLPPPEPTPDTVSNCQWQIYPNPSTGCFSITCTGDEVVKDIHIVVLNIQGQHMFEKIYNTLPQTIVLSGIEAGLYFIQLHNIKTNHYETHKIIIEH